MKDKKKKLSAKKQREQEIKQGQESICREILRHAQTLAEEMNVRLLLETGAGDVLFVECVTVTDIRFPDSRKHIFEKIGAWVRQTWERFRRFLMR